MIRPLALLHRRYRRLRYGVLAIPVAVILIYGALGIGFRHNPRVLVFSALAVVVIVVGLTVFALLAVAVVYLGKGRHNERATELLVLSDARGPKFVAPGSATRFANLPASLAGLFVVLAALTAFVIFSPSRDEFGPWFLLLLFLILSPNFMTTGIMGLPPGAYRLTLRPEHIELPSMLGAQKVPWAHLASGGPLRPSSVDKPIEVRLVEPLRHTRFFSSLVEPRFLADVIRHYVEHPEHRAQIGTPAEYERLCEALGLPSTQTHEPA